MSLKSFHIFFITLTVLFTVGFGVWGIRDYQTHAQQTSLYLGGGSLLMTVVLLVYGVWFLKKLKGLKDPADLL